MATETGEADEVGLAFCIVCRWEEAWPTYHQAGCASTWHVYENHPEIWVALFGNNHPPSDPDPRLDGKPI